MQELNLRGNRLQSTHFLAGWTALTRLDWAWNMHASPLVRPHTQWAALARVTTLHYLDLSGLDADGTMADCLRALAGLSLRTLLLREHELERDYEWGFAYDTEAHALAALTTLRHVEIDNACFSDMALAALSTLSCLTHLHLDGCCSSVDGDGLTSTSLTCLAQAAPALRCLSLNRTDVAGADLYELAPLIRLQRLNLRDARAGGAAPIVLPSTLSCLTHLCLANNDLHQANSVSCLANLPALVYLDLSNTGKGLSNNALWPLANLTALQVLSLEGNSLTGGSWVANTLKFLTALTSLTLSRNRLNGEGVRQLTCLRDSLCSLSLCDVRCDIGGVRQLSTLSRLTHLDLRNNPAAARGGHLLACLKGLRSLWMCSNKLNAKASIHLLTLTQLEYLDLSRNSMNSRQKSLVIAEAKAVGVALDI